MSQEKARPSESVTFLAFPHFVLTWPLIVMGWVLWIIAPMIGDQMTGIIWITTLFVVLIAMGFDFSQVQAAIVFLLITVVVLVMLLLTSQWKIPVFHQLVSFIGVMKLSIERDVMLAISMLVSMVYLMMIVHVFLFHRWVVKPGRMERRIFLGKEPEIPISPEYNVTLDFLDQLDRILLFNGGHLVVHLRDGREKYIGLIWGDLRALDAQIDRFEQLITSE